MKKPIIGQKINDKAIDSLIDELESIADANADFYVGYPVAATAEASITIPALLRRKQGHSTFLIDLDGCVCGGLTEWCRQELRPAGFEAVHAGFQGGDVRFEGVDTLVELGK